MQAKTTGKHKLDSLNQYFSKLTEFVSMAPHLLHAKSDQEFEVWMEKMEKTDRRALFLFAKKHQHNLSEQRFQKIMNRFPEKTKK